MFPFLTLTDGTISLRSYEFGDEQSLHAAVQESLPDLQPWLSWASENYTRETARRFIAMVRAQWSSGDLYAFAVTDARTDELLGGCSLSHFHPVYHLCNLGYWVRSSRRGQGIAGRAARLAARFAFERVHLVRAEIVIAVGNEPSRRVAQKIGAHHEGVLLNRMVTRGEVSDAYMFSLVPRDFGLAARA